jgi:hypothetical protein
LQSVFLAVLVACLVYPQDGWSPFLLRNQHNEACIRAGKLRLRISHVPYTRSWLAPIYADAFDYRVRGFFRFGFRF